MTQRISAADDDVNQLVRSHRHGHAQSPRQPQTHPETQTDRQTDVHTDGYVVVSISAVVRVTRSLVVEDNAIKQTPRFINKTRPVRRQLPGCPLVMESHGKVMENDDNVMEFLLLHSVH